MSQGAVYGLVLLSAVAHAAWNALVKSSGDRLLMLVSIRSVGLLAGSMVAFWVPPPARESWPFLAGAALIHYGYYGLMLSAYRLGDMSQVYPISRGVAPLLVALLAAVFAGEVLNAMSALGIGILAAGIFLLARAGRHTPRKALVFAVLSGVAIAGYTFLSGLGIRQAQSMLGYMAWLEITTGAGVVAAVGLYRAPVLADFAKTQWRRGLVAGLLSVGGYAIALWAMLSHSMAPVVALRETSVVFAAMMGAVVLREGYAARRTLAALTVLAGIVLLGMSTKPA